MPHYILSGRKGVLPPVTVLRKAASANEALAGFREDGYQDVVLHTDDAMAAVINPQVFLQGVTPRQWLQGATIPNAYAARFRRFLLESAPWWPLQLVGFVVVSWAMQQAIQQGDRLLELRLFWLLIPLLLASIATVLSYPVPQYWKLIDAVAWHRPENILKAVKRLRRNGGNSHLPVYELTFHEAKALAMQGKLDEALDLAETVREVTPEWLFWSGVSEIYTCAQRDAERLAAMEQGVRSAPDNPTCLLDLAMTLVRVNGDLSRAREAIQHAKTLALAEPIVPFVKLAEGMVAVQAGDAVTAVPLLEEALRKNEPAARNNALAAFMNDRTRAYLALAYHQLGQGQRAEDYFRQAERRLQLVPTLRDLRDRCLKELRCTPADEFS